MGVRGGGKLGPCYSTYGYGLRNGSADTILELTRNTESHPSPHLLNQSTNFNKIAQVTCMLN